ncbi:tRNA lysidine(34) synthetase TilS [Radiobacillus sp. PE A8.2]|uniref:tRNA lysidine(34) synthetase TilS n=1 Tax=Radiobacillus sp. PE A8.2 TaxID=3380349 RepID=UPI003890C73C
MEEKVTAYIRKHQLFHQQAVVLVGVSGGPDSMALLHFLCAIREQWGLRLIALSVDHGLRGEQSKQDVLYVKQMCEQWDVEFCETFLDVSSYKIKERKGTQLAARELRYQYFKRMMQEYRADYLALGHHADDQTETMMMRFVRGANPDALAGIPIKRSFEQGYIVRPFLGVSKQIIETYCDKHEISPRKDPSNDQDTYTRNFYRIHILPLLKQQNPNVLMSTQRLSEAISEDAIYLNEQAQKLIIASVELKKNRSEAILDIKRFKQYPIALQRRAYHLILNYLYPTIPTDLNYIHEDHFFYLLHNNKPNVSIDFPLGLKLIKSYDIILFRFGEFQPVEYVMQLTIPGSISLPDGGMIVSSITKFPKEESENIYVCEMDTIRTPLIVRTREPGDKMKIRGMNGSKKIKDIFIDEKIPVQKRATWPIVLDSKGNILWLIGLKKGFHEVQSASDGNFLQLHYKNNSNR